MVNEVGGLGEREKGREEKGVRKKDVFFFLSCAESDVDLGGGPDTENLRNKKTPFFLTSTDVLAFRLATIPALATDTVCCSITSCSIALAASAILSNSSMQQMPPSESTKAPDSRTISRVSGSRAT